MFSYVPYELNLLQTILQHRNNYLDLFFIFLHSWDSQGFYCLVGTLLYIFANPLLGKRYFLLLALNSASNYFLKLLFSQPRPLLLDENLGLVQTNSLYGLPSGGAQMAIATALFLTYHFKSTLMLYLTSIYVILICLSRIYVGMHFISDVFAGCAIGLLFTKLFLHTLRFGPTIQQYVERIPASVFLGLLFNSLFILTFIPMAYAYQSALSLALGIVALYRLGTTAIKASSSFLAKSIALGFMAIGYVALTNSPLPFVVNCFVYIILLDIVYRYFLKEVAFYKLKFK